MAYRRVRVTEKQIRQWWADRSITQRNCRALCGISYHTLAARAEALGLGARGRPAPLRDSVDRAALARLWAEGWSIVDIAVRLGSYRGAVVALVRALRLPPRPARNRRVRRPGDDRGPVPLNRALLADLWRLNVSHDGIAEALGISRAMVRPHVQSMGLAPRVPARAARLTLAQGRALLAEEALAKAWQVDARATSMRLRQEGMLAPAHLRKVA